MTIQPTLPIALDKNGKFVFLSSSPRREAPILKRMTDLLTELPYNSSNG